MRILLLVCAVLALGPAALAEDVTTVDDAAFYEPVLVLADGAPIAVEAPGFACPAFADVDGDGLLDLVVGQFREGKMQFFKNIGTAEEPSFQKGDWLKTGDQPARVPDVW